MNYPAINSWQDIQSEILERIQSRQWKPGELIPNEADLAREFGCARSTVNRALQAVADQGWIDRRRKAGTRVALHPIRRATLDIPILRREIELKGQAYSYELVRKVEGRTPPPRVLEQMDGDASSSFLHVLARHFCDKKPYAVEDRWINLNAVPEIADVALESQSANEWLVHNARFTKAEIEFRAVNASKEQARLLGTDTGSALFVIDRGTWFEGAAITRVDLLFAPGYSIKTSF